jgi:hypothetical protein
MPIFELSSRKNMFILMPKTVDEAVEKLIKDLPLKEKTTISVLLRASFFHRYHIRDIRKLGSVAIRGYDMLLKTRK